MKLDRREKLAVFTYPLIAVVGPIGVGKTTFASEFAEFTGSVKVREPFEDNPFLKNFYDRTKYPWDYSFDCQMFFMSMDAKWTAEMAKVLASGSVVKDAGRDVNSVIATAQWRMGFMTDSEMEIYTGAYARLYSGLPEPDLTIVLKAGEDTVIRRIKNRGREKELEMLDRFPKYFPTVVREFDQTFPHPTPKIQIIDTDDPKFDFERGNGFPNNTFGIIVDRVRSAYPNFLR